MLYLDPVTTQSNISSITNNPVAAQSNIPSITTNPNKVFPELEFFDFKSWSPSIVNFMGIGDGGVHQGRVSAISKQPFAESVECRSGKSYRSGSVHGEIELGRPSFLSHGLHRLHVIYAFINLVVLEVAVHLSLPHQK